MTAWRLRRGLLTQVAALHSAGAPLTSKLLLNAGQSNDLSFGATDTSGLSAINTTRSQIWGGSAFAGYVAGTNSEPTGAFASCFGPEAQYSVRFQADDPVHTIYHVKRPVGATSITAWLPGQTQFEDMKAWIDAAKIAINNTTITDNADIIFVQSEEDATGTQTAADAYKSRLMIWLEAALAQWGGASSRVAIVRTKNDPTNLPHSDRTREAQNYVAQLFPNVRLVNMDDGTLIDTLHYNSASVITMGNRCYDAIVNGSSVESSVSTFAGARLNPSDKQAACTLRNENLTACAQVNTGLAQVRSTVAIPTGSKRRFSVRIDRSLGSAAGIGLATGSYTLGSGDFFGAGSDALALLIGLQQVYSNSSQIGGTVSGSTVATDKVFDWALDTTANKFWLRVDGGTWLGGGSPDAGTGGLSIPAALQSVPLYVVLSPAGGGSLATEGMLTLNTGRDQYTYAMPTTFSDL